MQRTGFSFDGQNIYIGIDVHLTTWSVAIMTPSGYVERFAQQSDVGVLYSHLCKKYPGAVYYSAYESGFSGYSTHYALESFGIKNIIVNAADIPSTQKESLHKTDKGDALKIVKGLKKGELVPIQVLSRESISARELVRMRDTIVKDISRWKSRIKHLLYRHGVTYPEEFAAGRSHWTARFIGWLGNDVFISSPNDKIVLDEYLSILNSLRSELLKVTRLMRTLSRSEAYASNMQLIMSVPGIGFLTAITFLTEIGDICNFSCEKRLAAYIGIVPTSHHSGENVQPGEMTFRGNRRLRWKLIESAWTAIKCDPALSACFGEYCKRMQTNRAIVRIARKLSNRILSVLKTRKIYVKEKNDQRKV